MSIYAYQNPAAYLEERLPFIRRSFLDTLRDEQLPKLHDLHQRIDRREHVSTFARELSILAYNIDGTAATFGFLAMSHLARLLAKMLRAMGDNAIGSPKLAEILVSLISTVEMSLISADISDDRIAAQTSICA